jgi:hypothetical protein
MIMSMLAGFVGVMAVVLNPTFDFTGFLTRATIDTSAYKTVTLTSIPLTNPEVINPFRGFYKWRGAEIIPEAGPAKDAYQRYNWRDLEPTKDQYNFSLIDSDISKAHSEGRKFAFRVRDLVVPNASPYAVPDYIISERLAWSFGTTYVPDWANPSYQARVQKLLSALGQKYNGDPRIAWVDIGMFGQYGEWAIYSVDYSKAPSGVRVPNDLERRTIIDAHVQAFSKTQLVMIAKTLPYDAAAYPKDPVAYALTHAGAQIPMGWRVDCLGSPGYFDFNTNPKYAQAWAVMQDRWKTAPVITELCASGIDPTTALTQVKDLHVSLVGNGNIANWSSLSESLKTGYLNVGKAAGYRLELKTVKYPGALSPGNAFLFESLWINTGSAPTYEPWKVIYQLRNAVNGSVAWEGTSALNLKTLLANSSLTTSDTFTLPQDVLLGEYLLSVKIIDPQGSRPPLQLAITATKTSDGAYLLTPITISATTPGSDPVASPSVSPVASATPVTSPVSSPVANPSPSPVTTANAAPIIVTSKLSTARAGQAYSEVVEARDDNQNDSLSMSLLGAPASFSLKDCVQDINRNKKRIVCILTGTAESADSLIQLTVTDSQGATGTRSLKLGVR